jgi:hypothetical protein
MTEQIVWSFRSARTEPWPPELQSSVNNAYLAMILCIWSDYDRIRPHAKYQRREQPGSRTKKKENDVDHFVRSLVAGGTQDGQNVAKRMIVSVDTLHVVGS